MSALNLALTTQYWRRGGIALAVCATIVAGACWLTIMVKSQFAGEAFATPDMSLAMLYTCWLMLATGLVPAAITAAGSLRHRFAMPISTWRSMLIPLLNGTAVMTVGFLLVSAVLHFAFGFRWPVGRPLLVLASTYLVTQILVWLVEVPQLFRTAVSACLGGLLTLLYFSAAFWAAARAAGRIDSFVILSERDLAIVLLTAPVAVFLFGWWVISGKRRGELFLGVRLMSTASAVFGTRSRLRRFSSAQQALRWRGWVRGGRLQVVVAGLLATIVCSLVVFPSTWQSGHMLVVASTMWLAIAGIFFGPVLGHVGRSFNFNLFDAALPVTDRQLASAKLVNLIKSCLCMWGVWLAGMVLTYGLLSVFEPQQWVFHSSVSFVDVLLPLLMSVLVHWTLTSLTASLAMLSANQQRRALVVLGSCFVLLFLIGLQSGRWCLVLWVVLSSAITVGTFATSFRLRLIGVKDMVLTTVSYVLLCLVLVSLVQWRWYNASSQDLVLICSLLLLSVLPFAAAPLALWLNRHQ